MVKVMRVDNLLHDHVELPHVLDLAVQNIEGFVLELQHLTWIIIKMTRLVLSSTRRIL